MTNLKIETGLIAFVHTATKDQLLSLPGVTAAEGDRVIAGHPHNKPDEVVRRRIMPKSEYDKIAHGVTVRNDVAPPRGSERRTADIRCRTRNMLRTEPE